MCEERLHEGGAFVWDYCYIVHSTGGDPDLCVRRDCMRVGHFVWDYCYIVHSTGGDPDLCVRRDCMRVI